ncbi:Ig-like domain-containing protein [Zhouia spongiae]|uniref:Ig-like domain-containing protein n=1 Tax=Zhouia spongiae TaxID=2202721 RepID=A0ABY3YL19_9FLAO|nr:Ig-like domain-containing protein [Zhouia spongiae]UNY98289.1 Ig-like domain-containing protein [Zhouia spongiae]
MKQTIILTVRKIFCFVLYIFAITLSVHSTQAQITNAPANIPSPWTNGNYNVQANDLGNSGVCLGTGITDEGNLVDADLNNSATINLGLLTVACTASLSVNDPVNTYPAGTWAGYNFNVQGLLNLGVAPTITISIWNNGTEVESKAFNGSLLDVNLLANGNSTIGFVASQDFDEIRFEYFNPISLGVAYSVEVYNAVITRYEAGPALVCNTTTPVMQPAYPMNVSEDNSNLSNILTVNGNSDAQNAVDNNPDNYTTLNFTLGTGALAIKDEVSTYSAGTFAGFDVESTSLLTVGLLDAVTMTTYLDGVQQESINGTSNGILALNTSILNSGNERSQIGFITTQDFDEVQITGTGLLGSMNVYGLTLKSFCPANTSALVDNMPVMATEPDFPLYINGINTGISGIGVGSITNANAVIDADNNNYATIDLALGALNSASLSVADPLSTYSADTYTGFDISTGGLLNLELINSVTLTTYLDGVQQETVNGSTNELLVVDSGLLFGNNRYQVGFVASMPFDEVQITINQPVSVDLGTTNIHGLILEPLREEDIVCDITPLTNPGQPVILNSEYTGVTGGVGIGTSVSDAENVLTADDTDFATVTLGVGVLEEASIAVKNALGVYPAGSEVGFLIRDANDVLQVNLLDAVTITTYLDDVEVDTNSGSGLLLLEALGLLDLEITGDPDRYQFAGLISTGDYDEVRIKISGLASVINKIEVYGAYVNPRTIDGLENNPTITITSIADDDVVNIQEAAGQVNIVGQAADDAAPGDAVSVIVNGTAYNTTVQGDNSFTVQVPGSGLIADTDLTIEAVITHVGPDCTSTAEDTHEYTIDTTAPVIPTVNDLVTNDTTPIITGTADSVDELTVTVNGITYTEGDGNLVDNGDDTWALTVPAGNEIPEGTYDVEATATDAAGNPSNDATTDELTIDLTAPAIPTVNALVTNDTTPTLTGTADSVDELTVAVNGLTYTEGDGNLVDNGDNTWALTIPAGNEIPEGTYDVLATATDAAGNPSTDATTDELIIDTTDPTLPTVDPLITTDTTPTITGTADSVDELTVAVNGVTYTEGDGNLVDNSDDTWTLTVPAGNEIPEGTYDVVATATDEAGNTAVDNTTDELVIDLTDPVIPTVTPLTTNNSTPTITGTATSEDVLELTVNGVTYTEGDGNLVDNGNNTWSLTIPVGNEIPDGTYDVEATATDAAGNQSTDITTDELTVNINAPNSPTVNAQITSDTTPTITGTADSIDDLTVTVNGITYTEGDGNLVDNGDDTWTLTIPGTDALPDNVYDVRAVASDGMYISTDNTVNELTVDTIAPTIPTINELVTNDTTPILTGTSDSDAGLTIAVNGVTYTEGDGNLVDNGDNTWTLTIPAGNEIPEGVYDVEATATDAAGNMSNDNTTDELTIDLTAPTIPTVNELITNDTTPTITGTADSVDELAVTVNGITYSEGDGNLVDNGDDTWTLTIPAGNEIPDGIYNVLATATDAAGNPSTDTTSDELTIDTIAPTVPTVNELVTNDTTPTITGTADSVDELTVAVNGVTYTEGDGNLVDNGDDTWTLTIPAGSELPEGVYDVMATATDAAGNASTDVTTDELTIDITAPTVPTVNELVTNDTTPTITGTADSVDELTVIVNGVTYTEGDGNLVDNGDNTWTLTIPAGNELPEGVYDVMATATDAAGNPSNDATTDELTIDTTVPTVPTVNELVTNDTTPTITGTADSVDELTVAVNGVTYSEGDGNLVDNGDDTWTLTIPAGNEIPDGIYNVSAIATDAAGNPSTDVTTDELTIDTIAPTVPTVNELVTNDTTPTITGTADSVDELTVAVNGITYTEGDGNLVDNGDNTWALTIPAGSELPEGVYDVMATTTDVAGNTSNDNTTDELTIDTTAPVIPTVNELVTNDTTPTITGTADSVDGLTVAVNGITYTEGDGNLVDNGNNTWALTIPSGNELPEGVYDVEATATDAAGNMSNDNTTDELTIDLTTPTIPTVNELITNDTTPTITGTADSVDELTVAVNGVTYTEGDGNLVDNGDDTWTLTIPAGNEIPEGVYDVMATATDAAGNPSNDATADELTIDTTAPAVPTVNELATNDTTPTITGTADSVDELTVAVNGVTYTEGDGNLIDNGDATWSLTIPAGNELPDGVYDVVATATDNVGNTANDITTDELTIDTTDPAIPTVDPLITADTTPTITGTADSADSLEITVNGVTYTEGDVNLVDNGDDTWALTIPGSDALVNGTYDVAVTATDAVGNMSNDNTVDELTIDTTPPATPTVDELLTNDTTPIITGTAGSVDDLTVTVNGVTYSEGDGNLVDNGDDTWALTIPDSDELPDGMYDVVATATNNAGATASDNTTDEIIIDTSVTTPTVTPLETDDTTPTITGTADSVDDLTVTVNGVTYSEGDGNLVDDGDDTWTLTIPDSDELIDGTYDVVVTVTDVLGNTGNDNTADELTIEGCLHVYNIFSPNNDGSNDVLRIKCLENYGPNRLQVFNRYGTLVYEAKNYQNDWNGVANVGGVINRGESLPEGTYFYVLSVEEMGVHKKGWIFLNR